MLVNLLLEQLEDIKSTFRKSRAKQILLFIMKYKKVKRSNSKTFKKIDFQMYNKYKLYFALLFIFNYKK